MSDKLDNRGAWAPRCDVGGDLCRAPRMMQQAAPGRFVALVDDDEDFRAVVCAALSAAGVNVREFSDGEHCLSELAADLPDVICLDLDMPGMGGAAALVEIKRMFPELPVLVLSSHADASTIVQAMVAGAHDYMTKPLDLLSFVQRITNASTGRFQALRIKELEREAGLAAYAGLHGQSAAMKALYRQVDRVAPSDVTVLLCGESGSGKEVIATAIHQASHRRAAPMVAVNCAAIAESLQESELFGHERGAFTGAVDRRVGLFEQAHMGTLFLDEVAELSQGLQAKLLRVLQERKFRRVGGDKDIAVSVRILAASHKDLEEEVARGRFRQDHYYRIAVFEMHVPPLRDRLDDLEELSAALIQELARAEGRRPPKVSAAFLAALRGYSWPGNVRELKNTLHRALVLASSGTLRPEHLPPRVVANRLPPAQPVPLAPSGRVAGSEAFSSAPNWSGPRRASLDRTELEAAIEKAGGNMAKTARLLGIGRSTLYRKLQAFGIDPSELDG